MRVVRVIAICLALQIGAAIAAAPADPWFNPPGGTWVPTAVAVATMKADLDAAIAPMLAAKVSASAPPARYWFQYQGQGSGAKRTVYIHGAPFPVPSSARKDIHMVYLPESCVIIAVYVPSERRFDQIGVGGLGCPPRI